ncbi:MAG: CHAT domain-containing protein [Okeania sp. SIO3I5]|uniref:substrate-binding domain-containing protein n=1 Tax=Okeania sp. SIO3I5 TaxID=2607805 RepID=UPI0013B6A1D6|nr:substrate-binding domain-containing protein [Okeania sp. SIO3I5]NEQ38903.1 CHAT domain-containing protein [Okeania sp. SIO3I5]
MSIVKIKLIETKDHGFHVTLTANDNRFDPMDGFLPSLPSELESSLSDWQLAYHQLGEVRKIATRINVKQITNYSSSEQKRLIKTYMNQLKTDINQWLDSSERRWQPIREELIYVFGLLKNSGSEIRLFLDVENSKLRRLPWQEWSLLASRFPQAEIAVRARGKGELKPYPNCSNIRVLLVVGKSAGINTNLDIEIVEKLQEKGAEVICLKQPSREKFANTLREKSGFHIFIFSGHSRSEEDGTIGWISLNDSDELSIDEFNNSLRYVIDKGLQLAIFNSCDGLGLASQLAQLSLPRSIVMREPIPDEVAVKFLEYFLAEFTNNKSLFSSVHTARERLEHFEGNYPGAMWLPTICIRESALDKSLTWQELTDNLIPNPQTSRSLLKKKTSLYLLGAISLLVVGVVIGLLINRVKPPEEVGNRPLQPYPEQPVKPISPEENQTEQTRYFADISEVPNGNWLHGGSTTWAPIRGKVNPKIQEVFPEFKLNYKQHPSLPPGSGTGIKMLLNGQISFAESSRSLTDTELEIAKNRGFQLQQVPIAIDGIAIVVNHELDVAGLTLKQLQDIYTGKIKNWSEIGGYNIEILPYSRPLDSGTTPFFQENILNNKKFGENVVFIPTTTQALRKVTANKGAIYFATASEVIPQCGVKPLAISYESGSDFVAPYKGEFVPPENCSEQLRNEPNLEVFENGTYPITRRLFVIVKKDGSFDEKAGEAYGKLLLTDEGQKLIEKAGYSPIR